MLFLEFGLSFVEFLQGSGCFQFELVFLKLYLPYFLLLFLLNLLYTMLEDTDGLLRLRLGRGVYLFRILKLPLKIQFEFGNFVFLHFFELLHLLLVDDLDLDEFLLQLEVLLDLKVYLLLVSSLEVLGAIDVRVVQVGQLYVVFAP